MFDHHNRGLQRTGGPTPRIGDGAEKSTRKIDDPDLQRQSPRKRRGRLGKSTGIPWAMCHRKSQYPRLYYLAALRRQVQKVHIDSPASKRSTRAQNGHSHCRISALLFASLDRIALVQTSPGSSHANDGKDDTTDQSRSFGSLSMLIALSCAGWDTMGDRCRRVSRTAASRGTASRSGYPIVGGPVEGHQQPSDHIHTRMSSTGGSDVEDAASMLAQHR